MVYIVISAFLIGLIFSISASIDSHGLSEDSRKHPLGFVKSSLLSDSSGEIENIKPQQLFFEPLQEQHAIIYSIDVTNDIYEGGECCISVTVYNVDAGFFGADLYLVYTFYDQNGNNRGNITTSKYYVEKGEYFTFPTLCVPLADPNNPLLPPGWNTVVIDLWWDDSGTQRWQDQTKPMVQVAAVTPDWQDGYTDPSVVYDNQYTDITCYAKVYDYSGLTERGFGYKFTTTDWSSWTKWTDYIPGGTHWFSHSVPRSTWINHVGERLSFRWYAYDYWGLYAKIEFIEWTEIRDDDTSGPSISSVQVTEYGGDGDGIIEDDEQVKISWSLSDPSGIYSTSCTIDGASYPVYDSYYVIAGPGLEGSLSFTIYATDDDNDRANDRASSSYSGSFSVSDDDPDGPDITSVYVTEYNGDGDGIVEDDEQAKISWSLSDPSGIYSTSCTVDGASYPVYDYYYVIIGPGLSPGSHYFTISATDDDNDRPNDRASSSFSSSFSVSDDDPNPPEFSNWGTSPSGTVYDSYDSYIRLQVDWTDASGIYEVKFRYKYGSGSWSAWLSPTGSSGNTYWYDIQRGDWINYVGQTIYWESYATDNDNDRSGDRLTRYTSTFTGPTIEDDDPNGPVLSNPSSTGDVYDNYMGSYRIQVDASDPSGVYTVQFRYKFNGGTWSSWYTYSGYSGNTYWYDVPRNVWINHVGETIYWQVYAEDNDNDRSGDRATSTSDEYTGGTIYDDDATGPVISNPFSYENETTGSYRIQVEVLDLSGVYNVQFRYNFSGGPWHGWYNYTGYSGNTYWYDIPESEWSSHMGETMYWQVYAIDYDNDRPNDQTTTTSATYEAIIGQYQIVFQQSGCPLPVVATIDGENYTLPATFFWINGSSHNISVPAIINDTETTYEFIRWSDGNTNSSRTIVVTGAATYTAYYAPVGIHDVAVVNITLSKTIVGQGYSMNITVTIENQGTFTETLNLTIFYNNIAIILPNGKNYTTIQLANGTSTSITFMWNTTGVAKGNYTISAYAWPVPSETDTTDNTLMDGWVIVAMIGDVTGPDGWPDGKVNMRDIGAIARCFGTQAGDPDYNANYDIVYDGKIDMRDIGLAARHFGETDP